jgi:hypothetical protein
MGNFFKRSASEEIVFETHPLEPDETIAKTWAASTVLFGIFAKHGGNLVLTNKRVLFEPINVKAWPSFPITKYLLPFAEKQGSAYLSEVERAEAVPGMSARLRVISKQSTVADFLISASRFSSIWSSANKKTRDEAVAAINHAVGHKPGGADMPA